MLIYKEKLSTKTILYVEDELSVLEEYSELFSILFKNVASFDNSLEALSEYKNNSYDIVLVDITMPYMNGIELAKKIKEINSSQKIIALTGNSRIQKEELTLFEDWILKPVNIEILLDKLLNI